MSIGTSGRIVIEMEPEIKRQLYSLLALDGLTLKDWFLREVNEYLEETGTGKGYSHERDKRRRG